VPTRSLTCLAGAVLHVQGVPERVLEIECGGGDGALFLSREYPAGRVRGVDRSRRSVAAAVARIGLDPEGRVAFKTGTPRSLPFPDDHFDLVVQARGRLHPRELVRVLRTGGHLILVGDRGPLAAARLRRRGLTAVICGEAAGEPFYVARLGI
jgi:ubiquinone/menaquinone biosynthesis C-methylase UbiE